jgi:adenosine deaminase
VRVRDLATLPKAHLHVHLESTVRWPTLRELDPEQDGPPEGVVFDGFRAFADRNAAIRRTLRTAGDFERVAREFCEDQVADGVRYVEVTFTAASHGERLGDPAMPLEAVLRGLAAGRAATGLEWRVVLDHSRRQSPERAWRTLELARAYAADGVAGIGLAGDEDHPLAPFAAVCDAARDAGVRLVHHAGETRGPASIREALDAGHAERLGHGIRALEDASLVAELRRRRVPLEVCPSSNVALGLVPSFAEHPLPALRAAGLAVTLSTDIPNLAGVTLTDEYTRCRETFGWDDATLAELAVAAVDASFAPDPQKATLRSAITTWLTT